MALDLFVNYERTQNSSIFYRLTANSYTVSIKLSDLTDSNLDYTLYYAESSINGGPFQEFQLNNQSKFITTANWNAATPCVCSITVAVSSTTTNELLSTFSLSGIFLNSIPVANFVGYPTYVVYRDIDNIVKKKTLNSTNYYESSGLFFYGEGHTEIINLSSNCKSTEQAVWYVGNGLSVGQNTSVWEVTGGTPNNSQVSTAITSFTNQQTAIPISLILTDNNILSTSPIITYKDTTGEPEFYSYFASSLNISGGVSNPNDGFKNDIEIKPYPAFTPFIFQSPFLSSETTLPLDYSFSTFLATLTSPTSDTILQETFVGSQWTLGAESDTASWSVGTAVLPDIQGYQFQLGYYTNEIEDFLPLYKASSTTSTNITLGATAQKTIKIDPQGGPSDWLPKTVNDITNFDTLIKPIPSAKLYFPNYFIENNSRTFLEIIPTTELPYQIESITLQSLYSPEIVTLAAGVLSASMLFDQVGMVDLSATFVIKNIDTNTTNQIGFVFQNIIEVVELYDDVVEEQFYQTNITPLQLTYTKQPKIVPNEWAIADNVNSIIEKFYKTLEELDSYTKLYESKFKFYGWVGPKLSGISNLYVWQDLECPSSILPEEGSWAAFECLQGNLIDGYSWIDHECEQGQADPTCLQKYCIEWKWKSRKCDASEIDVTWKEAKANGKFAKKWKFEQCELANPSLNCNRDFWKISTFEPFYFPVPSCIFKDRCKIVDVEHLEATNHIVIAYPTELNIVQNNYYTTLKDNESRADQLFSFQNIIGLTTNSEGKIIVLDNILCKISIFRIIDNNLKLFNSWGTFGLQSTPQGFNQPSDIHIDQQNSLWVADTGNKCVKKFTINGNHLMTITDSRFDTTPPKSACVDSQLNCHVLVEGKVIVFDKNGQYSFEYALSDNVTSVSKINTNYKREVVYITYNLGVVKYFRTGTIYGYLFNEYKCKTGDLFSGFNSITQDKFRNVYITVEDKLLKVPDLMKITESKAPLNPNLYWKLNDLLIHKEEYIQPWVYLKAFHRLWDNIELFRNALFYDVEGSKSFKAPIYNKEDIVIGQNEIVTNSVLNRISAQLWANLETLFEYFKPQS